MVVIPEVVTPGLADPLTAPGNTKDLPPNEPCLITADTGILTPDKRTPGILTRDTGMPVSGTPTADMGTLTLVSGTP